MTAPRRAAEEPPSRRSRSVITAAVAGFVLLAGGTAVYAVGRGQDGSASGDCRQESTLLVDPAWMPAAKKAVEAFATTGCTAPGLEERPSAEVARQGVDKDGWIPEDPAWEQRLGTDAAVTQRTVVGSSPIVLVNRSEALKALGGAMDSKVVRNMTPTRGTWATYGHPEWGQIRLVVPPAESSAVGAAAFGEILHQVGEGEKPNGNPFGGTITQQAMALVQHRIVERPSVEQVTSRLESNPKDAGPMGPAGPRTGVSTEALVLERPEGVGATPLGKGLGLRMAVLRTSDNAAVAKFAEWLGTKDGATALAGAGVRTTQASPDKNRLGAVSLPASVPPVVPLTEDRLAAQRTLSEQYARRYSVLLALDLSGSMAQIMPGGLSRIEVLSKFILQLWGNWPPSMSTGLVTFHATDGEKALVEYPVKLDVVSSPTFMKNAPRYQKLFQNPPIGGGTPLYDAIAKSWKVAHEDYQEGADNRIVVVTDGRDADAKETHDYAKLEKYLISTVDPAKPVRVLYVALGPEADHKTLTKLAAATGQQAVQVSTQDELAVETAKFISN